MENNYELYKDIPVEISVEIGRKILSFDELSNLYINSTIPLDTIAGDHMAIYANGKKIGVGSAVVINEMLGVRITELNKESEYLPCTEKHKKV